MHVGIAKRWRRGKRSRHPGACATRNFMYLARGPWGHLTGWKLGCCPWSQEWQVNCYVLQLQFPSNFIVMLIFIKSKQIKRVDKRPWYVWAELYACHTIRCHWTNHLTVTGQSGVPASMIRNHCTAGRWTWGNASGKYISGFNPAMTYEKIFMAISRYIKHDTRGN